MAGTSGNWQVDDVENLEGYLLENDHRSIEEILQDQECLYQSLQSSGGNYGTIASTSSGYGNSSMRGREAEYSQRNYVDYQLKLDEEFAKALQAQEPDIGTLCSRDEEFARALHEMENNFGATSLEETHEPEINYGEPQSARNEREIHTERHPEEEPIQDNTNPDNMSHEQLQSQGEEIGTENRGLSDHLISRLKSSTVGFFSKKKKHEECSICSLGYKNLDKYTTLRCHHGYHTKCITKWLKMNKTCPVCNADVQV